ncbi:restriction endonuclease subunit S [Pseudoalteromonas sp. SG41-5]|nr:restriction endonuclease subunit S [Pseudoalteromonas sp. SG41-5]
MMEVLSIGDVCDFSRGLTYKKADEVSASCNAVLRANNITLETGKINFNDIKYISDEISIPKSKKVKKGSLLICTASGSKKHLGKIGLVESDIDFAYGGFMGMLTPKGNIDSKYLYWLSQSKAYFDFIQGLTDGANINNLKFSQLKNFPVPVFSLDEQKRIVVILDQAFADIEQARAKTEQNLKNARELFESYLQQVFSQRGDDWGVKKIAEIAEACLGKMLDKKKNKGNPKPYLRNQNVQWFNINTDDLLEMRFEDSEYERYAIKKGDLVICEGGYPGRGAIWEQDEDIFFQKALHRIRCHNPLYNHWILYYLYLSDCNGTLKNSFTGAGIQHFTGKSLKQLALPIPPVELTEKFVRNFDELFNRVISLENVYHNKLESIDQLKKSILQKAFSGELTKEKEGAVA